MIRSFLASETIFTSNGEKIIHPIKCIEHREDFDWYIDLTASLENQLYLQNDMILVVNTKEKGPQPFRIKNPRITSKVEVRAYHIGFDTLNHACELSTVINQNCSTAMTSLLANSEDANNFTVYSNIVTLKSFSVINKSIYNGLLQIAEEYNGILDFDGWQIRITSSIGTDRGVVLAYGKNIQESEVNENWDLVVTKLKPIGNDGITLSPEWLTADVSYDHTYTKIMDFDVDDLSNLALVAQLYLDRYKVPRVNYKVKADVEQNIGLGDSVVVKARQFTTTTEVMSFDYNVLSNRIEAIEFGNFRPTLKNYFSELTQQAEEKSLKRAQVKIDEATGYIEAYAENLISLAVGTSVKGQESVLPYTQSSWESGNIVSGNNSSNTTFIRTIGFHPINPSSNYVVEGSDTLDLINSTIYFYNGSTYLSSVANFSPSGKSITTPSNATHFRVRARKADLSTFTLIEMPNYFLRVVPVGKYLKGATYEFNGNTFTIKNNSNQVVFTADVDGNLDLIGKIIATSGKIGRFDLNNDDFVYTSNLFDKDYDQSDLVKLHRIILGFEPQTTYDLAVYDFNNSGTLNVTDLVILDQFLSLGTPLPTPRKRIRSLVRIGTANGALTTQAFAENGSAGPMTTFRGEKVTGDLLSVNGLYANTSNIKRLETTDLVFTNKGTLNDYREGTYEPVVIGATSAGVGTYSTQLGRYTKVGNVIHFNIYIAWGTHSGTGFIRISLPPFTSIPGTFFPANITPSGLNFTNELSAMVVANSQFLQLYTYSAGGSIVGLNMDTAAAMYISGSYMTS